jgi:hypothetical protein
VSIRASVAAIACASAAVAAQPAFGAGPATYVDGARDAAGRAPELTTVVVTNDDAGVVRFRINVGNQPRLARDARLELFLDTDRNAGTGDPLSLGADYRFVLDGATQTFDFARWDGAHFDSTAPSASVRVWYWSGVSVTIDRADLGGTSALAFSIRSVAPGRTGDAAPNQGTWTYELGAGGVNPPDIDSFSYRVRPASPRAGERWQLRVDAVRLVGSTRSVRPTRWSCRAALAGRRLRGSGAGGCTFRLPRSARGKRLAVTITVAYLGEVVSGTATLRVR